jgi:hypothetical protein
MLFQLTIWKNLKRASFTLIKVMTAIWTTCHGQLGRCYTNRTNPCYIMAPKVVKACAATVAVRDLFAKKLWLCEWWYFNILSYSYLVKYSNKLLSLLWVKHSSLLRPIEMKKTKINVMSADNLKESWKSVIHTHKSHDSDSDYLPWPAGTMLHK